MKHHVEELPAGKTGLRGKDFDMRWVASLRAVAFLAWIALAAPAFAQDAPPEDPTPADVPGELIRTPVEVTWNGPDPLRKLIRESLPPPAFPEGRRRGQLRPWVRDVRRRGAEIAAAEGYFSAALDVQVDEARENATVTLVPGPRTTVGTVEIEFTGELAADSPEHERRREQLRRAWSMAAGTPFRSEDWDVAKTRIVERLTERDYAAGRLTASEARVDAESATAALHLVLDSGPPFTLGPVEIEGLARYPESIVRRVVAHDVGDRYTLARLQELQRSLNNGPWFASVVVDIERDPARPVNVPVTVSVVERPIIDVGLALGFSTDTGPRAEVSMRHRNLLDRGFDLQSSLRVDQEHQFGYADVYLPPGLMIFPTRGERPFKDSVGVLAEHETVQNLDRTRFAVAGYRSVTLTASELRFGLSYQIEKKKPEGAEDEITRALAPVVAWTWRHVDDPFDPKRGGVLNLQVAAGGKAFASSQDFVKLYAQYTRWFTFTPTDQVIVRGEAGRTIAPTREGIPEDFLFRAGGARSNRGYEYESLGVTQGNAIVGGRYLLSGSADYIHWLTPQWGAALFYDVGDAADSAADWDANQSYGVGARYKTPAGPLALDLAYAERDRKFRISFSVTVAF